MLSSSELSSFHVMPGLDPGIHVVSLGEEDVDGRDEPGHDGLFGIRVVAFSR